MPRAPGQIDPAKRAAILTAAADVFAERGLGAPLECVAQRAGVSKQTIYNQFGSREELLRRLVEARRTLVTAPLDAAGAEDAPEAALAAVAEALMRRYAAPGTTDLIRVAIAAAGADQAEAARILYEAGPKAARVRLASYLEREQALGRLNVPDPMGAAEMFVGMVAGQMLLGLLLGTELPPSEAHIQARARECAERFVRAYAPEPAA